MELQAQFSTIRVNCVSGDANSCVKTESIISETTNEFSSFQLLANNSDISGGFTVNGDFSDDAINDAKHRVDQFHL